MLFVVSRTFLCGAQLRLPVLVVPLSRQLMPSLMTVQPLSVVPAYLLTVVMSSPLSTSNAPSSFSKLIAAAYVGPAFPFPRVDRVFLVVLVDRAFSIACIVHSSQMVVLIVTTLLPILAVPSAMPKWVAPSLPHQLATPASIRCAICRTFLIASIGHTFVLAIWVVPTRIGRACPC